MRLSSARGHRITTLALLQRLLGALLFSLLLFWLAIYKGVGLYRSSLQHLDHDVGTGSPQAQNLRVLLADMDNSVVQLLLLSPDEQQSATALRARANYTKRHSQLSAHLTRALERVAAAEGNTPAKDERDEIARLQNAVGAYDALTSRALTLHAWDNRPKTQSEALVAYRQARQQLDSNLLGTSDELSQSRNITFEDTDDQQNNARAWVRLGFGTVALLLFLTLVSLQVALLLRTHRLLNQGLVVATLLAMVLCWWSSNAFSLAEDQIWSAQSQRYHLLDLSRMRALVHLAHNSEGRLILLARDDAARQHEITVFHQKVGAVPGLISYGDPAEQILRRSVVDYSNAYSVLLTQLKNDQREAATRSYLQIGEGYSRASFNTFERAISGDLAASQSNLDITIAQGIAQLRYHELLASLLALAITTVTIMGVMPRFKEYTT